MDEIVPVSKPSRIADNATVDSRVATIKQRPSSRCFPSATDMNVSGSYEVLLSLLKPTGGGLLAAGRAYNRNEVTSIALYTPFAFIILLRRGLLCIS